jgi:hypothetical protein
MKNDMFSLVPFKLTLIIINNDFDMNNRLMCKKTSKSFFKKNYNSFSLPFFVHKQ